MSDTWPEEERKWSADKRDFVADWRDDLAQDRENGADSRDSIANDRERLADNREAALNERERRLDERERGAGVSIEEGDVERELERERAQGTASRKEAELSRDEARDSRGDALAARVEATGRRDAGITNTGLAIAFSEIARALYEAANFDDVLTRIVEAAVFTVLGCDLASITIRENGDLFRTVAATHSDATKSDEVQYDAREGPCVDAVDEALVHARAFPDERWPRLGMSPTDAGVNSVASFRLAATRSTQESPFAGSLNAYGGAPDAFDEEALDIGLILAAHASIAVKAVGERESLEMLGRQLHEALSSRDVIGQAKGILMERLHLTPEDAFDTLRRASQRLNVKLREVAERLSHTGVFEDAD